MNATSLKHLIPNERPAQCTPALLSLPHTERTFWRGTMIYSLDEPAKHIYLVISGRVKILRASAGGQQKILSIRYRGSLFGETALAGGTSKARRSDEAVALDTARVAMIRIEDFRRATLRDPAMAEEMFSRLAASLEEAHRQIGSLVFDNNSRRLMRTLPDLSREAARAGEQSVRLTHEELAELIGTARKVVTVLMLDLRQRGLVEYTRGEVRPRLAELARLLDHEEAFN